MVPLRLALGLGLGLRLGLADLDALALVQQSTARGGSALQATSWERQGIFNVSSQGVIANTRLGTAVGVLLDDHIVFRGIPYAEPPRRFEPAATKQPWAPSILQAQKFLPGCIGSGVGDHEDEDCLHMNIWVPKGGLTDLPVILYFHGGMNMHGSGSETLRRGDGVVVSKKYPAIFVNFDYRLGIFGWLYSKPGSGMVNNLGHLDQQEALRWLQANIAFFGGDPKKITLMGQSEGGGNIMNHIISPQSAGLFHRVIFHSPPAEVWSYKANIARTNAIMSHTWCERPTMQQSVECLRKVPAKTLWSADWTPEDLSRHVGSVKWWTAYNHLLYFMLRNSEGPDELAQHLGWHAAPDGNVPGEAHDLLPEGKFNKVQILLTVSKNESYGIVPFLQEPMLRHALRAIMDGSSLAKVEKAYKASLVESGIEGTTDVENLMQILTDKMFTCEAWALAKEITQGGGSIQLGGFWKSPLFDPVGKGTNKVCEHGATCHAAEMLYSLPQGHGKGIQDHATTPEMKEELAFANRYRDEILAFVYGFQGPWEPYRLDREVITLYDENGPRVVEGYRKKQCAILDKSWSSAAPEHMKRRAKG